MGEKREIIHAKGQERSAVKRKRREGKKRIGGELSGKKRTGHYKVELKIINRCMGGGRETIFPSNLDEAKKNPESVMSGATVKGFPEVE